MEYGPLLFYVNSSRRCRVEIGRVALPLLLLYSMPSAKFLDPQIYAFARGQLTQFLAGSKKPHAYYYIFLSNSLFMTVMMCVHFSNFQTSFYMWSVSFFIYSFCSSHLLFIMSCGNTNCMKGDIRNKVNLSFFFL